MSSLRRAFVAFALASAAILSWMGSRPAAAPAYTYHLYVDEVRDLGTLLGHVWSEAHAINELGAIAGSSETESGVRRAVQWSSPTASPQNLSHLGGGWSEAWGINDSGVIVGNSRSSGSDAWRAFRWTTAAGMIDLGVTGNVLGSDTVVTSTAEDINNVGVIVGNFRHKGSAHRGYLLGWGKAVVPHCGGSGSFLLESTAQAVNDSGYFTGHVDCAYGQWLVPYRATLSELIEIGPAMQAGGDRGYGIDAAGRVVGGMMMLVDGVPRYHAFRWSPTAGLKDLHTPGDLTYESVARGINTNGLIVGTKTGDLYSRAFVYGQGIGMTTLPSLCSSWFAIPWSAAYAVNDSGWVVGGSRTCSGDYHATLWKVRVVAFQIPSSQP